ncbi:mushroom body large-type Kenyon cell-specific protein 1 [Drosophila eugracilis]|uniref:mushroom body large-type Kenyon cell-specific protein 1 n=1 Tax=Drosophila eugracilis TaxID=29029 RepID=UPI001BDB26F5|nr:mushroom body large-type Kenyon cell-specific protein 1 [Drosophila eugracilis]
MMSYQKGLKDPNLDRHTSKAKSRHFTVNGLLSANNTLQQQQNQYNLQPSNDSRNIYNNPYIPPQQQQQQQQQQQTQQRTAHLFKALAASAGGTNSLPHPYDFSNSSSSSNANNDHQGSSSSEAENAFLTHNNGMGRRSSRRHQLCNKNH